MCAVGPPAHATPAHVCLLVDAKLKDFVDALKGNTEIAALKEEVITFARQFYMPG